MIEQVKNGTISDEAIDALLATCATIDGRSAFPALSLVKGIYASSASGQWKDIEKP